MTSISGKVDPVVRRITAADIAEALGQGLRDFQATPLYGLLFGALYGLAAAERRTRIRSDPQRRAIV